MFTPILYYPVYIKKWAGKREGLLARSLEMKKLLALYISVVYEAVFTPDSQEMA